MKKPVVVDKETFVLLDGHHRLAALEKLGCQKIPVYLVDYQSDEVRVYLRRKELVMKILKEAVLAKGLNGELFPKKTTRHLLKIRPRKKTAITDLFS